MQFLDDDFINIWKKLSNPTWPCVKKQVQFLNQPTNQSQQHLHKTYLAK